MPHDQALLLAIAREHERVIRDPNHEVDTTLAHMRTLNYKKRYATKRKLARGRGSRGGGSTGSEGGTHQARPTALAAPLHPHPHPQCLQGAPSGSVGPDSAVSGSMIGDRDVGQGAGGAPGLLGVPGRGLSHAHSPSPGIGEGRSSAAAPHLLAALVNRLEGAQVGRWGLRGAAVRPMAALGMLFASLCARTHRK